jgi:hypothetical protein
MKSSQKCKIKMTWMEISFLMCVRLLRVLSVTNESFEVMKQRGANITKYQEQLWDALQGNLRDKSGDLTAFREANTITDDDHSYALARIGWTSSDYDAVLGGERMAGGGWWWEGVRGAD